MPTDNRATAERIAREVYAARNVPPHATEPRSLDVALVLAGMAHRDRTAEREAARKAWDAAAERRYGPGWPIHSSSDKARDAYLAAEFDAGERVTLSDGSVVELDPDGVEFVRRNIARSLPRVAKREHWPLLVSDLTGADFDAVKRLAQRGAER